MICSRCKRETDTSTGSYFDATMICMDCDKREKAHPQYVEAKRVEHEAVKGGDLNYPGIGLPKDLRLHGLLQNILDCIDSPTEFVNAGDHLAHVRNLVIKAKDES